jgi:hypothetical protein
MAKNRIGLQFKGWDKMLKDIEKTAGEAGLKTAVDDALKASKQAVNMKVAPLITKSKMPAGGRYSSGETAASLDKDFTVAWVGYTGEIKIGFDFKKSGLTSIFLMYGTPRHKPPMKAVAGLYEAFYGNKTKKEIAEIQREAIAKYIERNFG